MVSSLRPHSHRSNLTPRTQNTVPPSKSPNFRFASRQDEAEDVDEEDYLFHLDRQDDRPPPPLLHPLLRPSRILHLPPNHRRPSLLHRKPKPPQLLPSSSTLRLATRLRCPERSISSLSTRTRRFPPCLSRHQILRRECTSMDSSASLHLSLARLRITTFRTNPTLLNITLPMLNVNRTPLITTAADRRYLESESTN